MPLYFLLATLTERGQQMARDNPDLMVEVVKQSDIEGADILGQYAVLGRYDFVMMAEADDNDAVARISLDLSVRIGLHIETLPALAIGVLTEEDESARESETDTAVGTTEHWRIPEDNS